MGKKENQIGGNDAVCTPAKVYEPVLQALGIERFDLDPCSHPDAIVPVKRRVLLPEYRTNPKLHCIRDEHGEKIAIYGDGLGVDWSGQDVWKNPPYSQLQYSVPTKKSPKGKYPWFHKLAYEAKRGVAFIPSRTSSGWWHHWVLQCERADILVQLRGRVKHVGHEYDSPFHQVVVGYNVVERAEDAWVQAEHEGAVLERWREVFKHGSAKGAHVSLLREMRA